MPLTFRETRPDELDEAVAFVEAGGRSPDTGSARHDLTHVAKRGGVVVAAAVFARDPDHQETVTVHSTPPPPEGGGTGDAGATPDAERPAAEASSGDTGGPDAPELARQVLDLCLMKLRGDGVCTTRVYAEAALAELLWQQAGWLDRLPELSVDPGAWLNSAGSARPDAVAVVRDAWQKVQSALAGVVDAAGDADRASDTAAGAGEASTSREASSDTD